MTQALNLANFANNLNTSGATSNAGLQNSTISGVALGSNLNALTIGTGLSGSSYNGSSAVTIANTGVTSITAGTGITVSGSTGGVTINSTVTSPYVGQKYQMFTASGTFTPVSGITAYKITLCGGGGGAYDSYSAGSAGAGTTTTFSTISSTGGGGAGYTGSSQYRGSDGTASGSIFTFNPKLYPIYATATVFYGNGGITPGNAYGGDGGDAPIAIGWVNSITSAVTVTVGTGGSGTRNGVGGFVLVEW